MSATWERLRRRLRRPVVSLVVPVHDVEPYLAECLDSLLGQTLPELEVIAVDRPGASQGPYVVAIPRIRELVAELPDELLVDIDRTLHLNEPRMLVRRVSIARRQ